MGNEKQMILNQKGSQGIFKSCFSICLFLGHFLVLNFSTAYSASTFFIFSISKDLPMGIEGEIIRKNYYVNIGETQGVRENSLLNVYRQISVPNPYNNKKLVNYKVKIGQLKVLHTSRDGSIAIEKSHHFGHSDSPVIELRHFMIGDQVSVAINEDD